MDKDMTFPAKDCKRKGTSCVKLCGLRVYRFANH
jgi:hypothetical protein